MHNKVKLLVSHQLCCLYFKNFILNFIINTISPTIKPTSITECKNYFFRLFHCYFLLDISYFSPIWTQIAAIFLISSIASSCGSSVLYQVDLATSNLCCIAESALPRGNSSTICDSLIYLFTSWKSLSESIALYTSTLLLPIIFLC